MNLDVQDEDLGVMHSALAMGGNANGIDQLLVREGGNYRDDLDLAHFDDQRLLLILVLYVGSHFS